MQGDERDRIIISVGYGPDEQGKFAMRFGPLNVQGGERRLNVAVTRAKEQVILVSSIHASDIDLNRVQSVGARMFRADLDYAERGTAALGSEVSEDRREKPIRRSRWRWKRHCDPGAWIFADKSDAAASGSTWQLFIQPKKGDTFSELNAMERRTIVRQPQGTGIDFAKKSSRGLAEDNMPCVVH